MIKIRLHGTPDEVEYASQYIRGAFHMLSESGDYKDRGKSLYVRRYIDAEAHDISTKIESKE